MTRRNNWYRENVPKATRTGFEGLIQSYIRGEPYGVGDVWDSDVKEHAPGHWEHIVEGVTLDPTIYTYDYGISHGMGVPESNWQWVEEVEGGVFPRKVREGGSARDVVSIVDTEDTEILLSLADTQKKEAIEELIDKVLFNSLQHETTDGYYLGFLPSGGKAIYIPSGWRIHIGMTNNRWDAYKSERNRYVVIYPSFDYSIPVVGYFVDAGMQFQWKLYPVLPHLAYVEYNEKWWKDYIWILNFKKPYRKNDEDDSSKPYYRWRNYYKKRWDIDAEGDKDDPSDDDDNPYFRELKRFFGWKD